jgi:hypothetical protein
MIKSLAPLFAAEWLTRSRKAPGIRNAAERKGRIEDRRTCKRTRAPVTGVVRLQKLGDGERGHGSCYPADQEIDSGDSLIHRRDIVFQVGDFDQESIKPGSENHFCRDISDRSVGTAVTGLSAVHGVKSDSVRVGACSDRKTDEHRA